MPKEISCARAFFLKIMPSVNGKSGKFKYDHGKNTNLIYMLLSFIINGLLIWKFCNINLLKVLLNIQKRCWSFMVFIEASLLNEVSLN